MAPYIPVLSLAVGFAADCLFGDPLGKFHIVVLLGKLISSLEKILRRIFPKTSRGELAAGGLLTLSVCLIAFGVSRGLSLALYQVHWALCLSFHGFLCWQCLAACDLRKQSMSVYHALKKNDLPLARKLVGFIVGRDTETLDEAGVCRACVETVAENCSDGEIAPLFYLALGGAPLGVFYKAVNTMDSMLGYKNERYVFFGRTAAKLDDIVNYLPSRLSAVFMLLSSSLCGEDRRNAVRIFRRDRMCHSSPNSAQTESVCAGALHIRLGGPSFYQGKRVDKPYIGDDDRPIEPEDIRRCNRMMLVACAIFFLLAILFRTVAICL